MAVDAVYDAICTFLKANVAAVKDQQTNKTPPFHFENEDDDSFPPNPPEPWVDVSLTGVIYGQQSIGASRQADNRWDERGTLYLSVVVPKGSGGSHPRWMAKQLADLFRGLTLLSGSLEFFDSFIGQGGPARDDGNWFVLPLQIEMRRSDA
jgi:hypothetical protein